jgi:hypothetical protein
LRAVHLGSTLSRKVLELRGSNVAVHCVGCAPRDQQPQACAAPACAPTASVCSNTSMYLPVVTLHTVPATEPWTCEVLCVAPVTSSVASVTCITGFPYDVGLVTLSVGGVDSPAVSLSASSSGGGVAPVVLDAAAVTPSACPSLGCLVTIRGLFLAPSELLVSNALGTIVVRALDVNATAVSVGAVPRPPPPLWFLYGRL